MRGFPARSARGFPGNLEAPYRAGMMTHEGPKPGPLITRHRRIRQPGSAGERARARQTLGLPPPTSAVASWRSRRRFVSMALVVHVVGARPNFMKVAPAMRALAARGVSQRLVHTGQHYDARMSDVFFEDLALPEPDFHLGVGSGSHAEQTAKVMLAF